MLHFYFFSAYCKYLVKLTGHDTMLTNQVYKNTAIFSMQDTARAEACRTKIVLSGNYRQPDALRQGSEEHCKSFTT